jgi:hypothetical protein
MADHDYGVPEWPTPKAHVAKYPTMSVEHCLELAGIHYAHDPAAVAWWWEAAAIAKRVYDE